MKPEKEITILLSTYNGETYLREQLNSIFNQSYRNFLLIARDDGSEDESLHILEEYAQQYKNIIILDDKRNLGITKSFSALLEYAVHNTNAKYFMFCDQDDVWMPQKIETTLIKMKEIENKEKIPILIHTDLEIVDQNLNIIHPSFWKYDSISPKLNSLNRLLMQNTITGCTVMINRPLAKKSIPIPHEAIMHDWWLGLVASKFGKIAYIAEPSVKYRQHGKNRLGASGYKNRLFKNITGVLTSTFLKKGKFYKRHLVNTKQAKAFLDRYKHELDHNTIEMLKDLANLEEKPYFERRKIILKHKLFKQTLTRNIGMFFNV